MQGSRRQQVGLHERQDLPDDGARGRTVIHGVEGMRRGGVIDESHEPIVLYGRRQERGERGIQSREFVPAGTSQEQGCVPRKVFQRAVGAWIDSALGTCPEHAQRPIRSPSIPSDAACSRT